MEGYVACDLKIGYTYSKVIANVTMMDSTREMYPKPPKKVLKLKDCSGLKKKAKKACEEKNKKLKKQAKQEEEDDM